MVLQSKMPGNLFQAAAVTAFTTDGTPKRKSMRQTIYFPGKFTDGEGLGVNTCERARVAEFPLRKAEIKVRMQKVTLKICTVK